MAKIISFLNQKGGVGKTTSVYNVGVALSQQGKKVLLIDNDPQASLTLMTGYNPLSLEESIVDIYQKKQKTHNCIYELASVSNVHLIGSCLQLAKTENLLVNEIAREFILKTALEQIAGVYDYILIDCPPALGTLTINSMLASDYVIAPCETSAMSIFGLEDLVETIEGLKNINNNLELFGVIATKHSINTIISKECLEELETNYNVIGVVKNSTDAQKGIESGIPTVLAKKSSDVAKAYFEIANKIIKENNA